MSADIEDIEKEIKEFSVLLWRMVFYSVKDFMKIIAAVLLLPLGFLIVAYYICKWLLVSMYLDFEDWNDRRVIKNMQRDAAVTARRMAKVPQLDSWQS
jgi:hypothetical protein